MPPYFLYDYNIISCSIQKNSVPSRRARISIRLKVIIVITIILNYHHTDISFIGIFFNLILFRWLQASKTYMDTKLLSRKVNQRLYRTTKQVFRQIMYIKYRLQSCCRHTNIIAAIIIVTL